MAPVKMSRCIRTSASSQIISTSWEESPRNNIRRPWYSKAFSSLKLCRMKMYLPGRIVKNIVHEIPLSSVKKMYDVAMWDVISLMKKKNDL